MIDLHTHTIFSDGELIPAELVRRAQVIGIEAIALTDHADTSNLDFIISRISSAVEEISTWWGIMVIPGVELTHIAPEAFPGLTHRAREQGAKIIVAHGETLVEPVAPGTNRAAILAGVDILAHPGLISLEDVELAREKGVLLEITSRRGHSLTNGHVARLAEQSGARMVFNTDAHSPSDLTDREQARGIVLGAGLNDSHFADMLKHSRSLARNCMETARGKNGKTGA